MTHLRRILCKLFGHIRDDFDGSFCVSCGERV